MFISLPFGTSLTFLLGLLSAILIAVTFCHLATKLIHHSILLAFIFSLLFSRTVAIAISLLWFSLLGWHCCSSLLSAIFNSSCHFYCRAIFIAAVHFVAVKSDSNYHSFSFICWVAIFTLVLSSYISFCC